MTSGVTLSLLHAAALLQELSALMSSKASRDDMRAVLGRAVGLALEAYRGSMGDRDASGASRTR